MVFGWRSGWVSIVAQKKTIGGVNSAGVGLHVSTSRSGNPSLHSGLISPQPFHPQVVDLVNQVIRFQRVLVLFSWFGGWVSVFVPQVFSG